jgi:hypothetical protein
VVSCAISYQYQYRRKGTTAWKTVQLPGKSNTSSILTGLLAATTYQWSVRAYCSTSPDTLASDYVKGPEFTTTAPLTCVPVKQWDARFGADKLDRLYTLQQTTDGGYILGGSSESGKNDDKSQHSRGDWDFWVVKVDTNGIKQWDKSFGGTGDDELFAIQQTTDGGYILGGSSTSGNDGDKTDSSRGDADYWVVKVNAKGAKQWDKTFGGNNFDALHSLQQTSDGGYILGGLSYSGISGDKTGAIRGDADYWIVKVDANGNKTWDKTLGGNSFEYFSALQQTLDGGYILGGYSYSGISGDKSGANRGGMLSGDDYWIVKVDANGNKIWDKTFGGTSNDELHSLQQTAEGGYILGGSSESNISGDKTEANRGEADYWIVKVGAAGVRQWDKTFGGMDFDRLASLQQTADKGYILGGSSESDVSGDKTQPSQGWEDYWVVKVDASGNKTWDERFGGNDFDFLYALQQTTDGGYILGGYSGSNISGDVSQPSRGSDDYWIVKLNCSATAIAAKTAAPNTGELMVADNVTLYPNPTSGSLTAQYTGATTGKVELKVYNMLGKAVFSKTEPVFIGSNAYHLNLSNLNQGLYILELSKGVLTKRTKFIIKK